MHLFHRRWTDQELTIGYLSLFFTLLTLMPVAAWLCLLPHGDPAGR